MFCKRACCGWLAQAGALPRVALLWFLIPMAPAAGARPVPDELLACTVCHGTDFAGNAALGAPRLLGLPGWYLREQLLAFRSGRRGTDPDDAYGAVMRPQAMHLSDAAIGRAVGFIIETGQRAGGVARQTLQKTEEKPMNDNTTPSFTQVAGTAALALTLGAASGVSAEVRRHALPGSDFPIAQAVEVMPGTTLVYHSGMTPRPADPEAEQYSAEYWGDTEAQTLSVFRRLEESLTAKGLTFGDVIKMQVFLVAPEEGGMMDFAGMMRAYRQYFGTEEQPDLPARSALQVAGLAVPGMLVEIEVVLARP